MLKCLFNIIVTHTHSLSLTRTHACTQIDSYSYCDRTVIFLSCKWYRCVWVGKVDSYRNHYHLPHCVHISAILSVSHICHSNKCLSFCLTLSYYCWSFTDNIWCLKLASFCTTPCVMCKHRCACLTANILIQVAQHTVQMQIVMGSKCVSYKQVNS